MRCVKKSSRRRQGGVEVGGVGGAVAGARGAVSSARDAVAGARGAVAGACGVSLWSVQMILLVACSANLANNEPESSNVNGHKMNARARTCTHAHAQGGGREANIQAHTRTYRHIHT